MKYLYLLIAVMAISSCSGPNKITFTDTGRWRLAADAEPIVETLVGHEVENTKPEPEIVEPEPEIVEPEPEDSIYLLNPALSQTLIYTGPMSGKVDFAVGSRTFIADQIRFAPAVWARCDGGGYASVEGDECTPLENTNTARWGKLTKQIAPYLESEDEPDEHTLFTEADRNVIEVIGGTRYGVLSLTAAITSVPSTLESSQRGEIYTLNHSWRGYPSYLSVETQISDDNEYACTRILITALGYFALENEIPSIIVDEIICGNERYDLVLSNDSVVWTMFYPTFSMEIEQVIASTRIVQ